MGISTDLQLLMLPEKYTHNINILVHITVLVKCANSNSCFFFNVSRRITTTCSGHVNSKVSVQLPIILSSCMALQIVHVKDIKSKEL